MDDPDKASSKPAASTLLTITGNATGSNRTKVALKPGYSLMGWIRHASGSTDLSGQPGRKTEVTLRELKQHNTADDCWMCIRGKVYNVTEYLDYHPGGAEELMKGAGINATKLFDDAHSYVNYESLLAKCLVGKLAGSDF